MLRNLKPKPPLCFVKRRMRGWKGAVEQISNMNQVVMYLQTQEHERIKCKLARSFREGGENCKLVWSLKKAG